MAKRATSRKSVDSAAKQKTKKSPPPKVRREAAEIFTYTVFISHSSKERWIAGQISKEIEALGAKTWLDIKDLRGGDEIRRSIKRGIRASQEAVVLLSSNSITSQWVLYEVGIAGAFGRRIIPVLNNLAPDVGLAPLQGIKGIDLNDFDDFLLELAGRIKNRITRARKAAV